MSVFSLPSQKRVARVRQGIRPDLIAFTPDGALAYVTNRDSKEVFVIDAKRHRNIKKIRVGSGPHGVLVVPPAPVN